MSVLSTVEKKKAELPRWREEPTTTPRRAGGEVSEPSAQWAVEEAPLATRTSSRAGALAARAPAVPLLLQVNETFRCAGARRDWERVGAGSWDQGKTFRPKTAGKPKNFPFPLVARKGNSGIFRYFSFSNLKI